MAGKPPATEWKTNLRKKVDTIVLLFRPAGLKAAPEGQPKPTHYACKQRKKYPYARARTQYKKVDAVQLIWKSGLPQNIPIRTYYFSSASISTESAGCTLTLDVIT